LRGRAPTRSDDLGRLLAEGLRADLPSDDDVALAARLLEGMSDGEIEDLLMSMR